MDAATRLIRRSRARQRGSLVIASFMMLIAMVLMVAGVQTMLREQIRQSTEIQAISFAKLQTLYLAEMGLNHVMYEANRAANVGLADPFPIPAGVGQAADFDFKPLVAMARDVAAASATCRVTRTGPNAFSSTARLVLPGVGNFTRTITFSAMNSGSAWFLGSYAVLP